MEGEPLLQRALTGGTGGPIEGPPVRWCAGRTSTRVTELAQRQTIPRSQHDAMVVQEQLIGTNNLKPISYLMWAYQIAAAVALVQVPGRGTGTGFLIGANVLLTNNHVLRNAQEAGIAKARFNYQYDRSGRLEPSEYFDLQPGLVFHTNVELDYSIVGVAGAPGHRYGVIPVSGSAMVNVGEPVTIIQHPLGQPKQIAMVDNEVKYADSKVVQYLTDTLPGSSGSPVFNGDFELIGLHHSGGWVPEPETSSTHFRNEGIYVGAIVADLARNGFA